MRIYMDCEGSARKDSVTQNNSIAIIQDTDHIKSWFCVRNDLDRWIPGALARGSEIVGQIRNS